MLAEHQRVGRSLELDGSKVLVIGADGVEGAWVDGAVRALEAAGAEVQQLWLTAEWDLEEDADGVLLADLLAGLEEPDRAVARLERLRAAGLLEVDEDDEHPAFAPSIDTRFVVIAGADPEAAAEVVAADLVHRLAGVAPLRAIAAQGIRRITVDEEDVTEAERRTGFVGPVRRGDRTAATVSTIDHLEGETGQEALALAMADLADGVHGHYGVAPGARAVRPHRAPLHGRRRGLVGRLVDAIVQPIVHAPAETWLGVVAVFGCTVFVLLQMHPDLLFARTTPAGGDMGAHVWGPAYLRDNLLPDGRLTGWAPDWYAGFPAFQFYMLPPALLVVLIDIVAPYGVALKLVTVLGLLSLPLAAYVMGRLFRIPFPGPPLLAVATVPFLFDRTWTIYGGNAASTLAGEYSFSISLSLALLFFGVLARSLDSGRHRGLAAVLLALVILCHAIPAFFAVVGGALLVLLRFDWRRIVFAAPVLAVGCLLTAFWAVPFVLRRGYLTDMGWEKLVTYRDALLPDSQRWVLVLALVGLVLAVAFWIRLGAFFGVLGVLFALGFWLDAASPVHIWNARLLPFYYLSLYMLAAIGVSEVLRSIAVIIDGRVEWRRRVAEHVGTVVVSGVAIVVVALPLHGLPGGKSQPDGTYEWLFLSTRDNSFVESWAAWNYSGYERKAAYPEYRSIMTTMQDVGQTEGCGRAHWEYEEGLNRYGTPMAMMLLPFWTDGCIDSMEGLYFESAGSTPFHFLNAAETSVRPSNPVRSLPERPMPYSQFDLDRGIEHLQLMGVRYYLAFSEQAVAAADRHPDLTEVATSPPWHVYEIADSALVAPLENEPAVLEGMDDANPGWQRDAVAWYVDPAAQDVLLARTGPSAWQRIQRGEEPVRRSLPRTRVTDIDEDDSSISFDVSRLGQPILVKTSYFPNWKVSGADGPYRVTPNLMVVVPTEEHVELTYGNTSVEYLGWALTLAGLAGAGLLVRRGQVVFPAIAPTRRREDEEGEGGLIDDGSWQPAAWPPTDEAPAPAPQPIGFWDSLLAERNAELAEAEQRAKDASRDRRPRRPSLDDADGDLGDDEPGPLGP